MRAPFGVFVSNLTRPTRFLQNTAAGSPRQSSEPPLRGQKSGGASQGFRLTRRREKT